MELQNIIRTTKYFRDKILTIVIVAILLSFSLWFIGGNWYNLFRKEQIKNDINTLTQELYQISPIQNYARSEVRLIKGRALIAKPISIDLYPISSGQTPENTFMEFKKYFINNGWIIEMDGINPNFYLLAKTEKYAVSLHWWEKRWVLIIEYNDFFSHYNL